MPYVVLAGSPVDGFRVVGPFAKLDDAVSWSGTHVPDEIQGTVAELEDPETVTWPD
jgi:hypothetical protein